MNSNVVLYVSLGLLSVAFFFQAVKPRLLRGDDSGVRTKNVSRGFRALFFLEVLFVLGWYAYLIAGQYFAWKAAGPPLSYLVPPYQSIFYVVGYYFARFGMYYAFSLAVALFFLIAAVAYNRSFGGRFFEPEEPYLGALALFLLGNPEWHYLWIYYLGSVFAAALLGLIATGIAGKENARFPLYYLWMPLAIAGILVMQLL